MILGPAIRAFVICLLIIPTGTQGQALAASTVVVGTARSVASVNMQPADDGSWAHTLVEAGAAFVKADLRHLDLPSGSVLMIRDGDGRVIERITGRGPHDNGRAWTLAVPGDRLTLDYRPSIHSHGPPTFRVARVVAGNRSVFEALRPPARDSKSLCAPADFEDVACYQADAGKWSRFQTTAGVLRMVGDLAIACTGVLVSPRDSLLTTATCLPDAAACSRAEFVFGHFRPGCGDASPAAAWTPYRCAETLESSPFLGCDPTPDHLDFSLHRAADNPSAIWGWSDPSVAALSDGEAIYMPQHAGGRPLEVVHGHGADVDVDGSTLRYYGTLDTESTSVGAPIFRDADDALVGLHHCGGCASPGVGNRGILMRDIEPLIAEHLCSDSLQLESVGPTALRQWAGNGDAYLDPGETWSLVPTLLNASCTTMATAVEASFQVAAGSAPITLLDTVSVVGDLAAGERGTGSPIRFRIDGGTACHERVLIDQPTIQSAGGSFVGANPLVEQSLGSIPRTVLLNEDFQSAVGSMPPAGWAIDDGGTGAGEPGSTWTFDDPGNRQLLDPPFAVVDSEFLGPGFTMDEALRSPTVDATAFSGLLLRFEHDFRWFENGLNETAEVAVRSAESGGLWTPLATFAGGDAGGLVELDLSSALAADVELRFRYSNAEWEWWWALDNIELLADNGPVCQPVFFADGFESGTTTEWSSVF